MSELPKVAQLGYFKNTNSKYRSVNLPQGKFLVINPGQVQILDKSGSSLCLKTLIYKIGLLSTLPNTERNGFKSKLCHSKAVTFGLLSSQMGS